MSDPIIDWSSLKANLDEVLYRDPPGHLRQLEVSDGATRTMEMVTFSDGSKIMIAAQVPLPPLAGMTPKKVNFINLNGERGEKLDDGSGEAMDLARQSVAVRFLENIARIIDGMPVCEKIVCPECHGGKCCTPCGGPGCAKCRGKGICQECNGHGLVIKSA